MKIGKQFMWSNKIAEEQQKLQIAKVEEEGEKQPQQKQIYCSSTEPKGDCS